MGSRTLDTKSPKSVSPKSKVQFPPPTMNRIILAYAPENAALAEKVDLQLSRIGIPFEHANSAIYLVSAFLEIYLALDKYISIHI